MHKIYFYLWPVSITRIYRKFYLNLASTNADNEMLCSIILASQVVMYLSLRAKGRMFESMCVLFLHSFDLFKFINYR